MLRVNLGCAKLCDIKLQLHEDFFTCMALKSTIYKADCQIADMDRGYYAPHNMTIALHPSETEERMMVRLVAFIPVSYTHLTLPTICSV